MEEDTTALRARIGVLERQLAAKVGQEHRVSSRRPCVASQVSPEILLSILRYTTPPAHCIDGTINLKLGGRNNLWLENVRTKKSLTLVCKSWNGSATEALYEHVILTRMGQIVAFARTLRLTGRNHIRLVKSLTLDRLLVLTTCVDVVKEDLDFILSRCSLLKHFAFRDVPQHLEDEDSSSAAFDNVVNPAWLFNPGSTSQVLRERTASQLRHLELFGTFTADQLLVIHQTLANAPHLLTLKLADIQANIAEFHGALDPVRLPALQDLTIDAAQPAFLDYVETKWQLPALHSLTLLDIAAFPTALLRAHGCGLTYLHLYHNPRPQFVATGIAQLAQLCPALVHLVLPSSLSGPLKISAPTVRHLDMWASVPSDLNPTHEWHRIRTNLARTTVRPHRCAIRVLGPPDSSTPTDLPRLFPPGTVAPGAWRVGCVAGGRVVQTSWALLVDRWPYAEMRVADAWGETDWVVEARERRRAHLCRCNCRQPRDVDCACDCHVPSNYKDCDGDDPWPPARGHWDPNVYSEESEDEDREEEDVTSVVSSSDGSDLEPESESEGAVDDLLVDRAADAVDTITPVDQLDRETILEMFSRSQDAWYELEDLYDDGVLEPEPQPLLTDTAPW